MGQLIVGLKKAFLIGGYCLLVLVGVLLFAVLAIAIRPLMVVVAIAALFGGTVLSYLSPGFRRWFET